MSFSSMQTPQRPLPGAFLQTPAVSRYQGGQSVNRQLFRPQNGAVQGNGGQTGQGSVPGQQVVQVQPSAQPQHLLPVQRAARTINEVLQRDASFPDLDSYVKQGISSDYDIASPSNDRSWTPFEKGKKYELPDTIYDQVNNAELGVMLGLFAELNHAWVAIDNALYLWDYTQTNPELVGYEDQPSSITGVKLVVPRPGVFIPTITHILVVATTLEMHLIGVTASQGPSGAKTMSLYSTGMSHSTRGVNVSIIEGSSATGRIFFAGHNDNDIYELTYQQEEKWFASRCGKVNHTSPGLTNLVPLALWKNKNVESVKAMALDDTRNLLYTLSSESTIRIFHMDSANTLKLVVEKSRHEILRDISHSILQTPLLSSSMSIVSINIIPAKEASKLHLMAVTSTGCRLFLSATRGYGYLAGKGEAPTSMQVQHVKFPPKEPSQAKPAGQTPTYQGAEQPIDIQSRSLNFTRKGFRYPPGLFMCFLNRDNQSRNDTMFLSAPDTGRISLQSREMSGQGSKYFETALWMSIEGIVEDIGLATKSFAATATPLGFGNELAVQFDEVSTEVAIMTNHGIQLVRRRRLVDIFAAAIQYGAGEEGLDGEMRKFIVQYGRGETTAAALAVACGQGADTSGPDSRVAKVTDPTVLEAARKAFVEYGGRPRINENAIADGATQAVDRVIPSSRHEGLALYISRLIRSLWKATVIKQNLMPGGAISISSTISQSKLVIVQDDLAKLDEFLEKNGTLIEGLSGPDGLQRAGSKQEEVALQGEHQALYSLQTLTKSIIESISFVVMLFDERIDELWASLDDATRQRLRDLTYEALFSSGGGKDLGKTLVKAIVNRNIKNGSNVDTVADALRRKCPSFCSGGDVMIFKAQEQLKRASELGANTELGRNVLNESLRLFNQVAGDLSPENLQSTVQQYIELQFYAGAIQLALNVAHEHDRGNKALIWVNEGKPENDRRSILYDERKRCYTLIHEILVTIDDISTRQPEMVDGRFTVTAVKRNEAYDIVNESEDELFHCDLYDWYLSQGWDDRILAVNSDFVVTYLQRTSSTNLEHADLLWKFYAHKERFFDAANVQLLLAKSEFELSLKARIEYLSRAKANASTHTGGVGRQVRQVLLHEVSELLEVANIQDDILQRIKGDPRIPAERRPAVTKDLDGQIHSLTALFNDYADQASYYGICLLIYEAADHRNPADIAATWQNLLDYEHGTIVDQGEAATQLPYERIINCVTEIANRVNLSDSIFAPSLIIPLLENYSVERQLGVGAPTWVIDLLVRIGVAFEVILPVLESMFYNNEAPFQGRRRGLLASHMVYTARKWYEQCERANQKPFGGEEGAATVSNLLLVLARNGLEQREVEEANELRAQIARTFR